MLAPMGPGKEASGHRTIHSGCSVPKARHLHKGVDYKRCASSDRSLAARGMAESAGDSRQFENGFRLDLRNSPINFRIVPRRWCSASPTESDRLCLLRTIPLECRPHIARLRLNPSLLLGSVLVRMPPIP